MPLPPAEIRVTTASRQRMSVRSLSRSVISFRSLHESELGVVSPLGRRIIPLSVVRRLVRRPPANQDVFDALRPLGPSLFPPAFARRRFRGRSRRREGAIGGVVGVAREMGPVGVDLNPER